MLGADSEQVPYSCCPAMTVIVIDQKLTGEGVLQCCSFPGAAPADVALAAWCSGALAPW